MTLVTETIASIIKLSAFVNKALGKYYSCCTSVKQNILSNAAKLNSDNLEILIKNLGDDKDLKDAYRIIKPFL